MATARLRTTNTPRISYSGTEAQNQVASSGAASRWHAALRASVNVSPVWRPSPQHSYDAIVAELEVLEHTNTAVCRCRYYMCANTQRNGQCCSVVIYIYIYYLAPCGSQSRPARPSSIVCNVLYSSMQAGRLRGGCVYICKIKE